MLQKMPDLVQSGNAVKGQKLASSLMAKIRMGTALLIQNRSALRSNALSYVFGRALIILFLTLNSVIKPNNPWKIHFSLFIRCCLIW